MLVCQKFATSSGTHEVSGFQRWTQSSGYTTVDQWIIMNSTMLQLSWVKKLTAYQFPVSQGILQNLTMMVVYAPTNPTNNTTKGAFYKSLQLRSTESQAWKLPFVARDWSAHTGPLDGSTCHIQGQFGLSQHRENGFGLVNFLNVNRLVICNMLAQNPQTHLLTWY